ncbi:MAG: hypothetical protein IJL87_05750 [Clostridia bacterium]|nr:hypothetical protein [Clostridia bacterium]
MIKGVNRQIIEIKNTNCPYFERIICCVNPRFSGEQKQQLVDCAVKFAREIEEEQKSRTKKLPIWLVAGISASAGALVSFILMLILN